MMMLERVLAYVQVISCENPKLMIVGGLLHGVALDKLNLVALSRYLVAKKCC